MLIDERSDDSKSKGKNPCERLETCCKKTHFKCPAPEPSPEPPISGAHKTTTEKPNKCGYEGVINCTKPTTTPTDCLFEEHCKPGCKLDKLQRPKQQCGYRNPKGVQGALKSVNNVSIDTFSQYAEVTYFFILNIIYFCYLQAPFKISLSFHGC